MNPKIFFSALVALLVVAFGIIASDALKNRLRTEDEKTIVATIRRVDPAVVSVVISKDLPVMERFFEEKRIGNFRIITEKFRQSGVQKKQVGGGTAFFITHDGLLISNAHVVKDQTAQYSVVTNEGKSFPVEVVVRNETIDLALLKAQGENFPLIPLSKSDTVDLGQTVIAIGNSLGEFRNTVSKGIISGIGRNVKLTEQQIFHEVLQTDAAINVGNSGGPLVNTGGELVGVNFSTVLGAENISFAIPINRVKELLSSYDKGLLRKNRFGN